MSKKFLHFISTHVANERGDTCTHMCNYVCVENVGDNTEIMWQVSKDRSFNLELFPNDYYFPEAHIT